MEDVPRQRVRQWAGALLLALPFVLVSALEANARLTTIQQSDQILQPGDATVEHDSFGTDLQHPPAEGAPGGEAHRYRLNPGR